MCANCQLEPGDIEELNRIAQQVSVQFSTGDIYPDYKVLVLTPQGPRVMRWGYMGEKGRGEDADTKKPPFIFNAKQETAWYIDAHREAIETGRIVVPTTGFYEWKPTEVGQNLMGEPIIQKVRHRFTLPGERVLYLPAIYKNGVGKDGTVEPRFTIITTFPNDSMIKVHNRMPGILLPSELESWMRDKRAAKAILTRVQPELVGVAA